MQKIPVTTRILQSIQRGSMSEFTHLCTHYPVDLDMVDDTGSSLAHLAICTPDDEMMHALFDMHIDVNRAEPFGGRTPLHYAVTNGNMERTLLLIKHGAFINAQCTDINKFTPLHIAVRSKQMDMVRLLLDANVDVTIRDGHGFTAAYWAQARNFVDILAVPGIGNAQARDKIAKVPIKKMKKKGAKKVKKK